MLGKVSESRASFSGKTISTSFLFRVFNVRGGISTHEREVRIKEGASHFTPELKKRNDTGTHDLVTQEARTNLMRKGLGSSGQFCAVILCDRTEDSVERERGKTAKEGGGVSGDERHGQVGMLYTERALVFSALERAAAYMEN